jgi:hypothetical protein
VKKYGSAAGARTLRKVCASLAAYDRIISSAAGSALISPRTVLIITGKKTSTATIIIFETGLVTPNQLFMIGAKATIGIAFAAMAKGIRALRAKTKRAVSSATSTPPTKPIANPPTASMSVLKPAWLSRGHCSSKVAPMSVGGGRRKR